MVRLTRITTKGGDTGQTSLGDGSRVAKHAPRVAAYGDVDELNAVLGLVQMELERGGGAAEVAPLLLGQLARLQNDLFDVGADLSVPGDAGERLRIPDGHVERLEEWIAGWNADLPPLDSFVLPAGPPATCQLHLARTVCGGPAAESQSSAGCRVMSPAAAASSSTQPLEISWPSTSVSTSTRTCSSSAQSPMS